MSRARAWLCWSSGKDSAWALHVARTQGNLEIVGLLTTVTGAYGRVSMHGVREEILEAQADALGLPLCRATIPAPCPEEVYQQEMRRAIEIARGQRVTAMIFGDLFLEDIRAYRESQLASTGMTPCFPLWNQPTGPLALEMISAGVVAHIACLDPAKLPRELAGHRFDRDLLARLPADVDPCAEHGEFHTCVTDGPMFSRPLAVRAGRTLQRDGLVFTDLVLAPNGQAERLPDGQSPNQTS